MDLIKAQHLLLKIQAFLENGNGNALSRLEKDLVKSYILQLYEAVTDEERAKPVEIVKVPEVPSPKTIHPEVPLVYEAKTEHQEPLKKMVYAPEIKDVPKVVPEIKVSVSEPVISILKPEPKPVHIPVSEPVLKVVHPPEVAHTPKEMTDGLIRLFELPNADELPGRFSHVPIANIESALGLNERIFTLKELFGGNKALFDTTCEALNALTSYREATSLLMNGPASQFNWADPERIKMAEHFIRIVARRYPKNGNG